MRRSVTTLLCVVALACVTSFLVGAGAAERPMLNVWPGKAPGETKELPPEGLQAPHPNEKKLVQRVENVSVPTLTVFQPDEGERNGTAIVVCPGGGYNILAWDLEGTEVAEWLNSLGVTAFVLKYRVPKRAEFAEQRAAADGRPAGHEPGPQPGRRVAASIRSGSASSASRPGAISQSRPASNLTRGPTSKLDATDDVSCRPDFAVLIYPAYLVDEAGNLKPEYKPTEKSPPMFFAHAIDDGVTPQNSSVALAMALKAVKVPAELHIYDSGGHGFGLRKSEFPCHTWPARCGEWLAHRGLLKAK